MKNPFEYLFLYIMKPNELKNDIFLLKIIFKVKKS